MPQNKILIDTNTYFRLAQSIHPLLKTGFGDPPNILLITQDLEKEFKRSARLRSKFNWFWQDEYVKNRNAILQLSKLQRTQFERDVQTILGIANDLGFTGLSIVDINGITYALILKITLVTDDYDMTNLAQQLGVSVISTLGLLKMMFDSGHIDMAKVRAVAGYWVHIADCPKDFKSDYKRIFSEDPP